MTDKENEIKTEVLQSQELRVVQVKEPCIGFT